MSDIYNRVLAAQPYKQVAEEFRYKEISTTSLALASRFPIRKELFVNIAESTFYTSYRTLLQDASAHQFKDAFILLEGARRFEFEKISKWLELKHTRLS